MIKSLIKNVIDLDADNLANQKMIFLKNIKKKLIIFFPVLIVFLVSLKYLTSLNNEIKFIAQMSERKSSEIRGYILKNNYVDKAINDANKINVLTQDPKGPTSLEEFKNTISHLSYYYKISGPLIIRNIPVQSSSALNPIKINITLSAKKDSQIVQFVDSLLTNLDGFVLIQQIDISQNSGNISGDVTFDWYTTKKIGDTIKRSSQMVVEPRIFSGQIEDKYRISVWNGAIVSGK